MRSHKATTPTLVLLTLSLTLVAGCSDGPVADSAAQDVQQPPAIAERTISEAPASEPARDPSRENCRNCGEVVSITAVSAEGESTGIGAALGAIVGGVAGNQVGGGSGKKIATVAGAVGGAVAGNEIEKKRGEETMYDVRIEMENGSEQTIRVPDASSISVGSAVTVEGNQIYSR